MGEWRIRLSACPIDLGVRLKNGRAVMRCCLKERFDCGGRRPSYGVSSGRDLCGVAKELYHKLQWDKWEYRFDWIIRRANLYNAAPVHGFRPQPERGDITMPMRLDQYNYPPPPP